MASPSQVPTTAPAPPDDRAQLDSILQRLEQERGRPAIVYWTADMARISVAAEFSLFDQLRACGKCPAVDLVLRTNGGDTEAPWRIVSLIREYADKLSVLIPHRALSSGTLIALGADEIVMGPMGALGPIDPSRTHPLLPKREGASEAEPISVQDMRHAMQFIREAALKDQPNFAYTPEAMAQIFSALFDKIHPLAIGAIEQSYALAKLIGRQCLRTHMGAEQDERITKLIDRLCDDYKSHQYQISRREAKEIGLNVENATPTVEAVLLDLLTFYTARPFGPFGGPLKPGQQLKAQIAWIDSTRLKFRAEQQLIVETTGQLKNQTDQWVAY